MTIDAIDLEVWFHQEDEVAVSLASSISERELEQSYEAALFAMFAARHIANMSGDPIGRRSLADALANVDVSDPLESVHKMLGAVRFAGAPPDKRRKGFTATFGPRRGRSSRCNSTASGCGASEAVGMSGLPRSRCSRIWLTGDQTISITCVRSLHPQPASSGSPRYRARSPSGRRRKSR